MIKLITISILLELYLCIGSPKRIARGHVINVAIAPIPEKHRSTEQIVSNNNSEVRINLVILNCINGCIN